MELIALGSKRKNRRAVRIMVSTGKTVNKESPKVILLVSQLLFVDSFAGTPSV